MRYDLMRLGASPQMHQHITSLANQALNLAENVDEAVYVADEMGRVGRRAHLGRAARHGARVTDHLLDRLVAAVGTQYLVDAEIGRGGMAVVYRATDVRLNRRVAIKVLPPELAFNADVRERFLREAQTSAQLTHPHIVPIYTVDEREGLVYFVMALVDGESLAQRLAREPQLPIADARRILADVADALAYAHARGVVHRDVKPDNIMLDRVTGRAVVTDFGIARAAAGDSRLTVTGVAVGTPAYMSPEQALGERELDGRSDIYSLGVVGYQMLAGAPPFRASNTPAMLVKHVSETPRPLDTLRPDAPAALVHAIVRALAKKPEDRWADAARVPRRDPRPARSGAYVEPAAEPAPRAAAAPRRARAGGAAPAFYQSPFTGPAHAPPRPSRPQEPRRAAGSRSCPAAADAADARAAGVRHEGRLARVAAAAATLGRGASPAREASRSRSAARTRSSTRRARWRSASRRCRHRAFGGARDDRRRWRRSTCVTSPDFMWFVVSGRVHLPRRALARGPAVGRRHPAVAAVPAWHAASRGRGRIARARDAVGAARRCGGARASRRPTCSPARTPGRCAARRRIASRSRTRSAGSRPPSAR